MIQEPQVERPEHQDNSGVHHQSLPKPVPEEQDVHADHDGYQHECVKHDGCLSSHASFLLRAAEWSQGGRPLRGIDYTLLPSLWPWGFRSLAMRVAGGDYAADPRG